MTTTASILTIIAKRATPERKQNAPRQKARSTSVGKQGKNQP
jgi:hypothetical protein